MTSAAQTDDFADIAKPHPAAAQDVQSDDEFADIAKPHVDPSQFSAPKDNKEGLYQMQTADGKLTQVPYSKVMDAHKAGYKISPDDRIRFGNDKVADLSGKGQKGNFNPDTDLPEAFHSISATEKTPWYKPNFKAVERGSLDLLPTVGGIGGGILGGGAGIETGPGAIATGAIGAAAGGGLGETIRQEVEEKLFPYDHRLTPKETAKHIAAQAGLQGANELTGRAAGKVLAPAVKFFGDTALASEKAGVRLLPSEAAGKAPSYLEKFLKGSVLTSGRMERFRELQNAQTKTAVEKLANDISNFKGTPEQLGQLVQDGIDKHTEQFRLLQNQMYKDIESQVGEKTVKVPVTTQVASKVLGADGKPVMQNVTRLEDRVVDKVMPSTVPLKQFAAQELKKLDQLEKVLHPNILGQSREMLQTILKAPNNLPYSAMRAARSDTLAKVRELDQALAGKQAGLAKKMAGLFDDSIMDAVKKSGIPGLEDSVRAADKFTATEHQMFEQQLVDKIVKTKKPEAIAMFVRNKNMGIQETRDLFTVLPKELHQPVQRQIILDTMRQSTNNVSKTFNERKFADTIGSIGDERGKIIFGKNWDNIKELANVMERINGPVGMQGGSGASLQNAAMIKNMIVTSAETAALPLGLASAHHPIGAVVSFGGEWVTLQGLASALTNPQVAEKILKATQQVVKYAPYVPTGALAVERGKRRAKGEIPPSSIDEVKTKGDELHRQMHLGGFAPAPKAGVTN